MISRQLYMLFNDVNRTMYLSRFTRLLYVFNLKLYINIKIKSKERTDWYSKYINERTDFMEQSVIVAIQTLGFPTCVALLLWYDGRKKHEENKKEIEKKDEENRKYTDTLIGDLKTDIKEQKEENKSDKEMFKSAIDSFNNSVQSFQNVSRDICTIQNELKDMKSDLTVIKTKVEDK